jgi:hypothetical protein
MLNFKPASSLLLLVILAACAAPGAYFPSLAPRLSEANAPVVALAESAAPSAALPAELAAKSNALLARHQVANQEFLRGLGAVRSTASKAAGASPGTESWVNAHMLLSRLDKARADSVAALRDFEGLIDDAGARDAEISILLTDAAKPVAEDVAAQNAEIARLSRVIGE